MTKKIFIFIIFLSSAVVFWLANWYFPHAQLKDGFYSFLTFTLSYLFFKIILDRILIKKLNQSRIRYTIRKTLNFLHFLTCSIIILRIWIPNPQALLVAYGLIAAGVAIALQDFFKNIAGGITLFLGRMYNVGDRIEVNGKYGDVIDIGLLYTTLLEIREWVEGDQPTGRLTTIPNGFVISHNVNNYTKDHSFIWDEISLPITYASDWKKATSLLKELVKNETLKNTKLAEDELNKLHKKYFVSKRNIEPNIFIKTTDNWIMLHIRYIAKAEERRTINSNLTELILEEIQQHPDIQIASTTLTINNLNELTTK